MPFRTEPVGHAVSFTRILRELDIYYSARDLDYFLEMVRILFKVEDAAAP